MKIKLQVESFYEAELCECGGYFKERVGNVFFMTDPIKAEFICNECGERAILAEKDFPGVKHRIKE